MKKYLFCLGLIAAVGFTGPSQAGIFVEPFVGYEFGNASDDDTPNDDKISGVHYGARLGYSMLGLAFGAEYSGSSIDFKSKNVGTVDSDITTTDIGLFVGYTFPIMFRVYGTYFLSSEYTAKASGAPNIDLSGDGGLRLGVGYTGLPFISLGLEYIERKYDEAKIGNNPKFDSKSKLESYLITVSLPLP